VAFSLFLCCLQVYGQTPALLKGQAVTEGKLPAAFVTIQLEKLKLKTTADNNGYFALHVQGDVNDTLVITGVGITTYKQAVTLKNGQVFNTGIIVVQYHTGMLPGVEITGRMAQSYKSDYTYVGTKTPTALKDIPQPISTITKELIEDKMDLRLKDAVDDVAGVNMYSGYDEYSIRGFRADNAHLINGLRAYNTTLTSPFLVNIERVEVIKGPAAVLYGNGDPGGTINLVTKKPLPQNEYALNLYTGSWNTYRASADATGPLTQDKKLLYRLNAGYENAGSFRDQYFAKSFQVAPSISYIPNNRVQLNADFSVSHTNTIADRGQPGFLNDKNLLSTPINMIITQPGDYLKETDFTSVISLAYKINSHISFNSAMLNHFTWQKLSEHTIEDYITPDSVYLGYATRTFNTATTTLTNYFAFNFNTGSLKHQLIVGYDYIKSHVTLHAATGETDDFPDGSGIVGTFSLKHPQYYKRDVADYDMETEDDEGDAPEAYTTQGAYIQEQVSYKNWQLLAGLRGEFYKKADDNAASGNSHENVLLPRIGVVYKPIENLSLYATYNRGFDPFEASIVTQVFNAPFKPINSEVYETGAKATLLKNHLFATLSVYQLTLNNVAVNANDPANPDLFVQRGKEQAKGFETEINGNILPQLSASISYSHNIAKVLESPVKEDIGKIKENAPRNSSSSWLKYTFLKGAVKGLFISAGHAQGGERNTLTEGLTLPAYFVLNGGVGYTYRKVKIALNVNNIGNNKYWVGGYNYANKWPGAPRNFMLNVGYAFGR
jgi:iron complex outermembrane receptor protein